jgi:hypothetical protein
MQHDALIAKKGRYGWRWSVVPLGSVRHFRAHGWIKILDTEDMADTRDEDIQQARLADEQRNPHRAQRWWGKREPPNTNDE